jgi:hypothetical protein
MLEIKLEHSLLSLCNRCQHGWKMMDKIAIMDNSLKRYKKLKVKQMISKKDTTYTKISPMP